MTWGFYCYFFSPISSYSLFFIIWVSFTAMSLLHTTVWLRLSHIWSNLSCPAVANCGKVGCEASPQTSSVCPSIAGLKPISTSPTRMQFLVVPTSNWKPRPSDKVLMPPKWSSICSWGKLNKNHKLSELTERYFSKIE